MKRTRRLEPKARKMIRQKLYEMGEITTEDAMDEVRPHFLNAAAAEEKELRRTTQQMLSGIRDEKGVRSVFNCTVDGISTYIRVEACKDLPKLQNTEDQLNTKLTGLCASAAKVKRRRLEVEGQLSLDLDLKEANGEGDQ